jgi:hypothetical protein
MATIAASYPPYTGYPTGGWPHATLVASSTGTNLAAIQGFNYTITPHPPLFSGTQGGVTDGYTENVGTWPQTHDGYWFGEATPFNYTSDYCAYKWWIAKSGPPLNTTNITVNVKSNTTGENIPRADVVVTNLGVYSLSAKTDLNGNATFPNVNTAFSPFNIIVSKAGYNTSNTTVAIVSAVTYIPITLGDYAPPPGAPAMVVLDVADLNTGSAIGGATVGIENTTEMTNAWRYGTFSESSIEFNTTDISPQINLSVGQSVIFSGYKSGVYTANNTGTYTIPSALSHLTLYLIPTNGNASAVYFWPVTITDAQTGNVIGGSSLSSTLTKSCDLYLKNCSWYNQTSSSGKFNVNGTGLLGAVPISLGDQLLLEGNAAGYIQNGFPITMSNLNNGITQFLPLTPSGITPIAGEFTVIFDVYDTSNSAALNGVTVTVNGTAKTTNSAGTTTFTNLTAGNI